MMQLHQPIIPRIQLGIGFIHRLAEQAEQLCGLEAGALQKVGRAREISWARFAVMKVARERGRSLPMIARALGGLDHTSVLHGIRRADEIKRMDRDFAELLNLLRGEKK